MPAQLSAQLAMIVRDGTLSAPVRTLANNDHMSVVSLRKLEYDALALPVVTRTSDVSSGPARDVYAAALAPEFRVDDMVGWSHLRDAISVSEYLPGRTAAEMGIDGAEALQREIARLLRADGRPAGVAATQARLAIQRMHAFDYAIGNTDRGKHNVMIVDPAAPVGPASPLPSKVGPLGLIDADLLGMLDHVRIRGGALPVLNPTFVRGEDLRRAFVPFDDAVIADLDRVRRAAIEAPHRDFLAAPRPKRRSMFQQAHEQVTRSRHLPTAIGNRVEQMVELGGIPLRFDDTRGLARPRS